MTYRFMCIPENGGCGAWWREWRPMDERNDPPSPCPRCGHNKHASRVFGRILVNHDLDFQEGRLGDTHVQPAFGSARVRTRQDLKELQLRTREGYFRKTDGPKVHWVPDPDTGKLEKVTMEQKGIDCGEIHTAEGPLHIPDHAELARNRFERETADFRQNYVEEPYTG